MSFVPKLLDDSDRHNFAMTLNERKPIRLLCYSGITTVDEEMFDVSIKNSSKNAHKLKFSCWKVESTEEIVNLINYHGDFYPLIWRPGDTVQIDHCEKR